MTHRTLLPSGHLDLPAASKTLHIHPPAITPSSGLLSSIKTLPTDHGEGIEKRTGESHYTTIDLFISRAKASKPKPEKDQQKNTKNMQRKKNERREKGIENRYCDLCTEKKKNRPHPLGTTVVSSSPSPPTATPRVSNRQQRNLPPFSFPAAAP
ncbi:hypothetical protein NC653_037423 [Populus alba x Populus x berolinensis]|uniref:Uncharacterized protein n=1 Tax=Populus alba x Populus x berolinensis TaxID=444605 RepID=A0AAD6LGX6_9ROSI|nr:hypothetical protein NC653_037423 [Populus alba x Populus x berolinensis]